MLSARWPRRTRRSLRRAWISTRPSSSRWRARSAAPIRPRAFGSVTDLAGRFGSVLGGIGGASDLVAPVTHAVDALSRLGSSGTDLKTSLIGALSHAHPGDRPVDRLAAGAGALTGLDLGPFGDLIRALGSAALPALPPTDHRVGQADRRGRRSAHPRHPAGAVAGRLHRRCQERGPRPVCSPELADQATLDAARTAALGVDPAALVARIGSGDPEDDVVAAVTAGLGAITGFTDAVNRLLLGSGQLVELLDLGALEPVLGQAATAAAQTDTAPVRALAQALRDQLAIVLDIRPTEPAAASAEAFGDFLAGQLQPLVDAVNAVQLAAVVAPVQHAIETVLAPIRTVAGAIHDAVQTIHDTLEKVRAAIAALGLDTVVRAVHTVIDPIVHVVDQVKQLLDPVAATLGQIASQTSAAISQLRATLDSIVGPISAAFNAVRSAVDALHLDQLSGLRAAMDEVAQGIESISIGTAVDEAVGFIAAAADVVKAIPFDLLPDSTKSEVGSALAPIKNIDFDADVRDPLSEAVNEVLAAVEGPGLDELTQAFGAVTQFLTKIDPRPELATIESEGFAAFVSAVQAIDPDAILAPVKEALSGLGGLQHLLDPADEAFDKLLTEIDALDPAPLLDPIAATVDEVRTTIVQTLALDRWTTEINAVCDQILRGCGSPERLRCRGHAAHPARHILARRGLTQPWPRRRPAGGQDARPGRRAARCVSFAVVGEWITGQTTPAAALGDALGRARTEIAALRARASAVDPAAVLPTVGPAFDQISAAVNALPEGTLKNQLSPLVVQTPQQLLQPSIDGRVALLTTLDQTTAVLDRLTAVSAASLGTLAGSLKIALSPLSDGFTAFAHAWVVRMGGDPVHDLRAALAGALTVVANRLRTELDALQNAIRSKLRGVVDGLLRQPLTQAATDIAALVATIDLHPLTGEVEAIFAAVRDPLAALRPSTALADLVKAIDDLVGESAAWDPFRDVRAPLAQLKTDLTAAADELSPTKLLAPILETYDTIVQALGAIDVVALFDRTLTALHALEADIEDGLTAAGSAFGELQDALPAA